MSTSIAEFMGGGRNHALTGNLTLKPGWQRLHCLDPDAGGREVNLPDATKLKLGGPHFILINIDASLSVAVKDASGGAVLTLEAQRGAFLGLSENGTPAGRWSADKRTI